MRLHVWPDIELPAQKTRHPIHDHVFDMTSTVIRGQLVNKTYKFVGLGYEDNPEDFSMYALHRAQHIGPEETVLTPVGGIGYLRILSNELVKQDHSYALRHSVLHDSVPVGLTATIMHKHKGTIGEPYVAVPFGVQPDNNYRREAIDEETLWSFIARTLES